MLYVALFKNCAKYRPFLVSSVIVLHIINLNFHKTAIIFIKTRSKNAVFTKYLKTETGDKAVIFHKILTETEQFLKLKNHHGINYKTLHLHRKKTPVNTVHIAKFV